MNSRVYRLNLLYVNNQSLVIWEAENEDIWADSRYLVCKIWHSNDFSAVLNVEFFRNETRARTIVAQSGDLADGEIETPRMAAKIGVLPHLKTNLSSVWQVLNTSSFTRNKNQRKIS